MPTPRILLPLLLIPAVLLGQDPTRDSSAAPAVGAPLPVLDDDGNVIPEDSIAALIRPPRHTILRPVVGAILGLAVFGLASQPEGNADCSIYEPCTPREKWRQSVGPWLGLFLGGFVGAMVDRGVDRWEAVEKIRAARRIARQTSP